MITPDPSPTVSCSSVLLVHADWLGFLTIFCPLLPQLLEQTGAQISFERSTFIGNLEELSLSGLRVVGGEAVVYSGGSSVDGDSILISQKPQAVEGGESHAWKLWEADGSSDRRCILSIICNITRSCYIDEWVWEKNKTKLQQEAFVV